MTFVYDDSATLWEKMEAVAKRVYRASEVTADAKVRNQIKKLQEDGYGHYPVCVAKTQSSFSTDASLRGAPSNHVVNVREVRLAAGADGCTRTRADIDAALAHLASRGIRLIDAVARPGAERARVAFIHPSAAHGVLVELVQHMLKVLKQMDLILYLVH